MRSVDPLAVNRHWISTVLSAQANIKAHRFGNAVPLFERFEREFKSHPQSAAARRCTTQVRELVKWNYQSLSSHAEELLSQDEVDRAMAIYLGIVLV